MDTLPVLEKTNDFADTLHRPEELERVTLSA